MTAMTGFELGSPALGNYDLSWVLNHKDEDPERVLVVDVGGGKGQALRTMFEKVPGLEKGRCVLEDLEEVLEAGKGVREEMGLAEVKTQGFDMFAGQPVKGGYPLIPRLLPSPGEVLTTPHRRTRLLHAPLPARLQRQRVRDHPGPFGGRHGARQPAADCRAAAVVERGRDLDEPGHDRPRHDVRLWQGAHARRLPRPGREGGTQGDVCLACVWEERDY